MKLVHSLEGELNAQSLVQLSHPYRGFLYDCDGTLASTMAPHREAWVEQLQGCGIKMEAAQIRQLIDELSGMPAVQTIQHLNQRFGWTLHPEKVAKEKEQLYLEKYAGTTRGIEPVVQHLVQMHELKKSIAVVSGGRTRVVRHTLQQLGILDRVSVLVCAEDVRFGKPHPEPFLMAAQKLGVPANECLVFEDAPFGIQSATAAGMQWIRVVES